MADYQGNRVVREDEERGQRVMLKAVIYSRVSTGVQAERGTSLEDQVAMCTREAEKIGAEVFAHYQDAGVSGALYLTRPGIQDALRAIEDKKANILIIHSVSRGGRMVEGVRAIASRLFHVGGRLFIAGRGEVGLEGTDKALLTMGKCLRGLCTLSGITSLQRLT
jgi:predicted site-specific integrase-resolvase